MRPVKASIVKVGNTSGSSQFEVFIGNLSLSVSDSLITKGLIKKPRSVAKGSLEGFRTTLHEIVPELKDLTDEDVERLIEERKSDI